MATSNDPVTFWGHKLGQTDHKGHRDLWGHAMTYFMTPKVTVTFVVGLT